MLTMRLSPMGGVAVPGHVWLWLCHHRYGDAGGRVAAAVPQPGWQRWGTCGCAAVSVAMPGHAWPWPRRDGDKAGWLPCPSALPAPWVSLPEPSRFCQIRVPQGLARLHVLPTSLVPGTHGDQGHVSPGAGLGARWDPAILHPWVPPPNPGGHLQAGDPQHQQSLATSYTPLSPTITHRLPDPSGHLHPSASPTNCCPQPTAHHPLHSRSSPISIAHHPLAPNPSSITPN